MTEDWLSLLRRVVRENVIVAEGSTLETDRDIGWAVEAALDSIDGLTSAVYPSLAINFLDAAVDAGRGPVTFAATENGNVGVWLFDVREEARAHGCGDNAEEALISALNCGLFRDLAIAARVMTENESTNAGLRPKPPEAP